jgi:hypothetical protein
MAGALRPGRQGSGEKDEGKDDALHGQTPWMGRAGEVRARLPLRQTSMPPLTAA